MILSYRGKKTPAFANGDFVKAFAGFEAQAERRLAILNAAPSLDTLRALPSNRLQRQQGRAVFHSRQSEMAHLF